MSKVKCYDCLAEVESKILKGQMVKACTLCLSPVAADGMPYKLEDLKAKVKEKPQVCYFEDCDNNEATHVTLARAETTCKRCNNRLRLLDYQF